MRSLYAAIMLKNESHTIIKTLDSVCKHVGGIKLYDTGSTDDTLAVVDAWHKDHPEILLEILTGTFTDFATSRNEMLDFADKDPAAEFLLLLDSNDELVGGDALTDALQQFTAPRHLTSGAFYMKQKWLSNGKTDAYFNIRCCMTRQGWRYKGKVHEYLTREDDASEYKAAIYLPCKDTAWIFQDRSEGAESSLERYQRDVQLLEEQLADDIAKTGRGASRTLFYLAQTYSCLGRKEEAYKTYAERARDPDFREEQFHAHLRAGDICPGSFETAAMWYLHAYKILQRVEPLVRLAKMYSNPGPNQSMHVAHMFTSTALTLAVPTDTVLFLELDAYSYERYHLHGIVAWYVGDFESGRAACEKAIAQRDTALDRSNLKFYVKDVDADNKDVGQD